MYIWTYCRTLLLTNFPQDRFSSKTGHRPIIIDRCVISWKQIFPICGSEAEDPLPDHLGHPIWHIWIFSGDLWRMLFTKETDLQLWRNWGTASQMQQRLWPQMLQSSWRDVEYRLGVCRAIHTAHIEINWPSSETLWVFILSYVKVNVHNPLFALEIVTYFSMSLAWTPYIYCETILN